MTPLQWILYAKRTVITGTVASAVSLVGLLVVSHRMTGSAPAALNGSSQLIHGEESLRAREASFRHTLPALLIHHASAHWWASAQEHPLLIRRIPHPLRRACALMTFAFVLDYGVLPRRLSPGFEGQLPRGGIAIAFGAIAAGLALGSRIQQAPDRLRHRIVHRLLAPSIRRREI